MTANDDEIPSSALLERDVPSATAAAASQSGSARKTSGGAGGRAKPKKRRKKASAVDGSPSEKSGDPPQRPRFSSFLAEFVAFRAKNERRHPAKSADVVYRHSEADLAKWMEWASDQRRALNAGRPSRLSEQEVAMLDRVDFPWRLSRDEGWDRSFGELGEWREKNGHCNVPFRQGSLGRWVGHQRSLYKAYSAGEKSSLTAEKVAKMDSLGFQWETEKDAKSSRTDEKIELLSPRAS